MRWFGTPWPAPDWPAPVCGDERMRVMVPLGQICLSCGEAVELDDSGVMTCYTEVAPTGEWVTSIRPQHAECLVRGMLGSLAHLERRCSCYGGTDHDTPGLSVREEARLVFLQMCEQALAQRDS